MKTIIKFGLILISIVFYYTTFSQNNGKTVTLDGLVVKLDEITEDKPLKINMDDKKNIPISKDSVKYTNESVQAEIAVYTNKNKNSFLKVDSKVSINKNFVDEVDRVTTISFYDSKGNKVWGGKNNLETYYSRIELNGKYIFLRSISPKTYVEELSVFNSNGNVVFEDKGILRPFFNSFSNSVSYETESSDMYTLNFYNANNNSKWSKTFPLGQRASYFCISPNGEKVAVCVENFLYLLNYEGLEIWKKPYKKYSGFVNFSTDGNYLLWNLINVSGDIEVYDCNLGNKLYKYSQAINSKDNIKLNYASFVEGLNEVALLKFPTNTSTEITMISMKGDVLKKLLIDKQFNTYCNFQKVDKNTLNIYFDYNLVKSIDINW